MIVVFVDVGGIFSGNFIVCGNFWDGVLFGVVWGSCIFFDVFF